MRSHQNKEVYPSVRPSHVSSNSLSLSLTPAPCCCLSGSGGLIVAAVVEVTVVVVAAAATTTFETHKVGAGEVKL